ncbi:MAG: nucleotidyltransferase domain-containing protein [Candidatus Woesearchaeota archaeon]
MDTKKILKTVVKKLKPETRTVKEAEDFLKKLNKELKKNRIKAKATLGGSYAKDTWLKGDYDVDIFVKFGLKYKGQDLSNLLEKALKPLKPERLHGSRDYFWIRNKMKFEIVPVLDIKKPGQAQNVTDFSPWHVKWVNSKGKKYKDDIRLVKRFMKAQGCYGAESYIQGFSGHVVDILVIYYKGFLPLLKAAAKWKPKVIVDYYGKVGKKAEMILNKSKIQGPLIVIDPVQPDRNAAAAVSQKMFDKFTEAAKKFLKNPSEKFFEYKEIDWKKLSKKGKLIILDVEVPEGKEDPVGAKLMKAYEYIKKKLDDFKPGPETIIKWDKQRKAMFGYLLKQEKLPEEFEWPGPPAEMKEAAELFKKKHKKTFLKKGRIYAKVRYEYRTPEELLEKIIFKDEYLKDKVKKCRLRKA